MITKRHTDSRGHADHGWLDAYHTFSFAGFRDPEFMGFGDLLVLNQDTIQPGQGFGTHAHDNMEIVTYVLSGALEHKDSMANGSQILPGDVQLISAGTGVTHSEYNALTDQPTSLLQMWVLPERRDTRPRYQQKQFPVVERRGKLRLVADPDGRDGALTIGADVRLYAGLLDDGEAAELELLPGRRAWLHVARGSLALNDIEFGPGDGAAIVDESMLRFEGRDEAEFVLFDLT